MTEIESSRWTIHGERVVDESRRLRLRIAEVELPDGIRFEQYVRAGTPPAGSCPPAPRP
jgi:hypothetical protein